MKNITVMAVLLLTCQLCLTAMAGGQIYNITEHNVFSSRNGVAINPPQISYVTNGKPLQGWVFCQQTGSTDIMTVSYDGNFIARQAGGNVSPDPNYYEGSGDTIVFNSTPVANKPVVLKMNSNYGYGNINYFNNDTAFDGWIRVKTLSFSGYANGSTNIGDGVWLGWADNILTGQRPKDNPNYHYDDLVFILQGVTPIITDSYGNTDTVNLANFPSAYSGNRLVVTSWREENKY
jgi:hypothetical protein